ncbi:MAG: phage holin family protein [Candidatus Nanopelagicaceae bacterium]
MKLIIRWATLTAAFWVATLFISGIKIDGGVKTYFWVALLFGLINALLGSIIKLITLPFTLLSFGAFLVIINAAMLQLTDRWSDKLSVDNFWSAIFASLIISVVSGVLRKVLPN